MNTSPTPGLAAAFKRGGFTPSENKPAPKPHTPVGKFNPSAAPQQVAWTPPVIPTLTRAGFRALSLKQRSAFLAAEGKITEA
ncbi:hypothetical protein JO972_01915 [Verrucomicrobiaceae bacterium 5K15]|uniref:Uncharacterized protein n=1 Tax=Oceaniferula flava TaxID=2800421 RepID=A0AAE2SAA8_9BACT|nr:hypothetical protein [Oceaniferula flavus]MBK1853702.1 hypothetical protein [Oceaniferula flavus]MBM1135008.1 hypothetical protein [Oceaniferula flavus]